MNNLEFSGVKLKFKRLFSNLISFSECIFTSIKDRSGVLYLRFYRVYSSTILETVVLNYDILRSFQFYVSHRVTMWSSKVIRPQIMIISPTYVTYYLITARGHFVTVIKLLLITPAPNYERLLETYF